jgi:hypothetical protein
MSGNPSEIEVDWDDTPPAKEPVRFEDLPVIPVKRIQKSTVGKNGTELGRSPPHSVEAEEYLLGGILLDGRDVMRRCRDERLSSEYFYSGSNRIVYEKLEKLYDSKSEIDLVMLSEELRKNNELEGLGGYAFLTQISGRIPTTAQVGYFIKTLKDLHALRRSIKEATGIVERAYLQQGDIEDFIADAQARFQSVSELTATPAKLKSRGLFEFSLAKDKDKSILLGNRYLSRGDGAIIVSTSGMGKSAMAIQMATELALNKGPFGIHGNGPLRTLIVQSEDSDGDVAEVAYSLQNILNLTKEQIDFVNDSVRVITDRVNRGERFLNELRKQIAIFKPDIVIINPLQAFMDGDVTDGRDLGAFLREGLNSINEPATFGYIIIHHTTKPATGKEKSERLWHEVMYDMAGGAELINWARAIISLRADEVEGNFNLVLAKRGRRAGVTKQVPHGMGTRLEPVTTIPLKHATGRFDIPGIANGIPKIYWESREVQPEESKPSSTKAPPDKYIFSDFRFAFPPHDKPGRSFNEIQRLFSTNGLPSRTEKINGILSKFTSEGFITEAIINDRKTYNLRSI